MFHSTERLMNFIADLQAAKEFRSATSGMRADQCGQGRVQAGRAGQPRPASRVHPKIPDRWSDESPLSFSK
jgi:hypothetical protein